MNKDHQYATPVFTVDSVLRRTIPLLLDRTVLSLLVLFIVVNMLVNFALPRHHPFWWLLGLIPFYFFKGRRPESFIPPSPVTGKPWERRFPKPWSSCRP